MPDSTMEAQYNVLLQLREQYGLANFGLMSSQVWGEDPRRIAFLLARYKFVSKMLAGRSHVLEVGCADAFGTRLVQQTVTAVTAVDFDPLFIEEAKTRIDPRWPLELRVHDMLAGPVEPRNFDGMYSLDVLEHIEAAHEDTFLTNVTGSLTQQGVAIIGCPSLESQVYASPQSKEGHVNCKTGADFKALMEKHFHNVFLFSMNDEVVHTGFYKMAHYLIALCCGKR
jgi:cyclopropane fatty-acyl-phospholipid synthase-like methyltransferase